VTPTILTPPPTSAPRRLPPGVAIIVPAYNEEETIADVVAAMRALRPAHLIVVDDGSRDRTAQISERAGALVIRHPINRGAGGAIATGLAAAQRFGVTIAVTVDADGQHVADDVLAVVAAVEAGEADLAIGARTRSPGMPRTRRLANWIANVLTFIVFGTWVTDSQSGLRAFSRAALERLRLRGSGFEVSSEIVGEIGRLDLRVREVPIRAIYTAYSMSKGQSFTNGLRTFGHMLLRRF